MNPHGKEIPVPANPWRAFAIFCFVVLAASWVPGAVIFADNCPEPSTAPGDTYPSGCIPPGLEATPKKTDVVFPNKGNVGGDCSLTPACFPFGHYWYRTDLAHQNNRLRFTIPLTRLYWNETFQSNVPDPVFFDDKGFLRDSAKSLLVEKNLIPEYAKLTLRVFDVDDTLRCFRVPEIDHVYVNGCKVKASYCGTNPPDIQARLYGANGAWSTPEFQVPITCLKIPQKTHSIVVGDQVEVVPEPVDNVIEIEVDAYSGPRPIGSVEFGMAINWATLTLDELTQNAGRADKPERMIRPILLVYGFHGSPETWNSMRYQLTLPKDPDLDESGQFGLPFGEPSEFGQGHWGVDYNRQIYSAYVDALKRHYGTDKINIIAHSKGVLDSRAVVATRDDVEHLVALAGANHGSFLATASFWTQFSAPVEGLKTLFGLGYDPATWDMMPHHVRDDRNYIDTAVWYAPACYHVQYVRNENTTYSEFYGGSDWTIGEWSWPYPWWWRHFYINDPRNELDADDQETEGQSCKQGNPSSPLFDNYLFFDPFRFEPLDHESIHDKKDILWRALNAIEPHFTGAAQDPAFPPPRAARMVSDTAVPPVFAGRDPASVQVVGKNVDRFESISISWQPTKVYEYQVASADTLIILVVEQGGADPSIIATLKDPDGKVWGKSSDFTSGNPRGVSYDELRADKGIVPIIRFTVADQAHTYGKWSVTVKGYSLDEPRTVTTSANVTGPDVFLASVDHRRHLSGERIAIRGVWTGPSKPSTKVQATLQPADGQNPITVSLSDDGQHDDESADDGVFGGYFEPPHAEGWVPILFSAKSGKVERVAMEMVLIVPRDVAELDRSCGDPCHIGRLSGLAAYGDGCDDAIDRLCFTTPFRVRKPGLYELGATLTGANGVVVDRQVSVDLFSSGTRCLEVCFKGGVIAKENVDGPYRVTDVTLSYCGQFPPVGLDPRMLVDRLDSLCTSWEVAEGLTGNPITANDFRKPHITLYGPHQEATKDPDGNGKANTLVYTVGVDVGRSGTYSVEGELVDDCGGFIGWASTIQAMEVGPTNPVPLSYASRRLFQGGADRYFILKHVIVKEIATGACPPLTAEFFANPAVDTPDSSLYRTNSYNVSAFEGHSIGGKIVDSNGDALVSAYVSGALDECLRHRFPWGLIGDVDILTVTDVGTLGTYTAGGLEPGEWVFQATGFKTIDGNTLVAVSDTVHVVIPADSPIDFRIEQSFASGVDEQADVPRVVSLRPVYPNPMGASGVVRFSLPRDLPVTLRIFDVQGRLVSSLATGIWKGGEHDVRWNGRDERGQTVSSGIYFLRLEAGSTAITRRIVTLR